MNILDLPYVVEVFFILSTVVFFVSLVAILPMVMNSLLVKDRPNLKQTFFHKVYKTISNQVGKVSPKQKKKPRMILILIDKK